MNFLNFFRIKLWLFSFFLFLLLSNFSLYAIDGDTLILHNGITTWEIDKKVSFMRDDSNKASLADILKSEKFKRSNTDLHLGVIEENVWANISLLNKSFTQENFVLVVDDASLTFVELFLLNNKNQLIFQSSSGAGISQKERMIKGSRIAFPLNMKEGRIINAFIKVRFNAYFTFPIKIQTLSAFYEQSNQIRVGLGVFYGMILLLGIYNIVLSLIFKEKVFIYFMATSLFYGLGMATYDGFLSEYLYPLLQLLRFCPEGILTSLSLFFSVFFIREFLGVRKTDFIDDFLKYILYFCIISIVFWLFFPLKAVYVAFTEFLVYVIVILTTCIWAYTSRIKEVKYLIVASAVFALAGVLSVSATFGIIDSPALMNYGLHLGCVGNLFIISLGITDRVNEIRNQIVHKENQILKEKEKRNLIKEEKNSLQKTIEDRNYELLEQNRELKKVNNELGKVNAELDRFVYSVSHELRSPLKSLQGLIKLMEYEHPNEQMKQYLEHQEKSIVKLDDYAQEIIDLMRNARLEVQKENIKFDKIIDEVIKNHKNHPNFEKTSLKINIIQHQVFISDEKRIFMILNNLISNAFHYQKEEYTQKEILITVITTEENVQISVSDNGQGIQQEYLSRIFDMFYRIHEQSVGSGLGLYIVKQTIDKLKGHIFVNSRKEEGTHFEIEIPNLIKNIVKTV
jgi:signal transduction histidine kinase